MAESIPTINSLAQQMNSRQGVWWAVQSSKTVPAGSTSPKDQLASSAAEKWVKNPTPENHAAALTAAKEADLHGPGAWAAQAAGWSKPDGGALAHAAAPGAPAMPALAPYAVAGSVKLSAALASGAKLPELPTLPKVPVIAKPTLAMPALTKPTLPGVPTVQPPAEPSVAAQMEKAHQPFIEMGKQILAGKKLWA